MGLLTSTQIDTIYRFGSCMEYTMRMMAKTKSDKGNY
jgi:hypothetical protein